MSGWVGIGDYSELIIGVATETRKSGLPPLLYSGGLFFLFMSVPVSGVHLHWPCDAI